MTIETLLSRPDPVTGVVDDATASDTAEASPELRRAFWMLVVIVDVAMLAFALGVLLLVFEGRLIIGGASLAIGLVGFAESYRRIRARRNT